MIGNIFDDEIDRAATAPLIHFDVIDDIERPIKFTGLRTISPAHEFTSYTALDALEFKMFFPCPHDPEFLGFYIR